MHGVLVTGGASRTLWQEVTGALYASLLDAEERSTCALDSTKGQLKTMNSRNAPGGLHRYSVDVQLSSISSSLRALNLEWGSHLYGDVETGATELSAGVSQCHSYRNLTACQRSPEETEDSAVSSSVLLNQKNTLNKIVAAFNKFEMPANQLRGAIDDVKSRLDTLGFSPALQLALQEILQPILAVHTTELSHLPHAFAMDCSQVPMIQARENETWLEHFQGGKGVWDLSTSLSPEAQEMAYLFFKEGKLPLLSRSPSALQEAHLEEKEDFVKQSAKGIERIAKYFELLEFADMAFVPSLSRAIEKPLLEYLTSCCDSYTQLKELYFALSARGVDTTLESIYSKCENVLLAYYIHGAAALDKDVLQRVKVISRKRLANFHSSKLLALLPFCENLEKIEVNYLYQEHIDLLEKYCPKLHSLISARSSFTNLPTALSQQLQFLELDKNKQIKELTMIGDCHVRLLNCYRMQILGVLSATQVRLDACYNLSSLECPSANILSIRSCVLLETVLVSPHTRCFLHECHSLKTLTLQEEAGSQSLQMTSPNISFQPSSVNYPFTSSQARTLNEPSDLSIHEMQTEY